MRLPTTAECIFSDVTPRSLRLTRHEVSDILHPKNCSRLHSTVHRVSQIVSYVSQTIAELLAIHYPQRWLHVDATFHRPSQIAPYLSKTIAVCTLPLADCRRLYLTPHRLSQIASSSFRLPSNCVLPVHNIVQIAVQTRPYHRDKNTPL